MKLHRLIAILLLLESRGTVNANALARGLEVSKRTIHRDIEELCEAGVPIASSAGQAGGYRLMNGYASNLKSLCTDEVVTLYLSGIGIQPQKHTDSGVSLRNALMKLEKMLSSSYADDIRRVRERFLFDPEMWWNPKELGFLETLRKAALHSQRLRIVYAAASLGKNETGTRVVRPYGLVVKHSEWYLVGFCESRHSVRTFKCDRIHGVDTLPETFDIPDGFSLEEYWNKSISDFKDNVSLRPVYPVKLKLVSQDFELPESYEILERNNADVTVNLYAFANAVDEIWGMKNNVSVIAPEELKACLMNLAERFLKNYTGSQTSAGPMIPV